MYSITLTNGTKLENLELNGNNYIAQEAVEDSVFEGNMETVIISDGESEEVLHNQRLMSNLVREGRSWIVIGDMPQDSEDVADLRRQVNELTSAINALLGNE